MKAISFRDCIRVLGANGFYFTRQNASHQIWKNMNGRIVIVPIHGKNRPIYIGTLISIIKQSGLPKNLFER